MAQISKNDSFRDVKRSIRKTSAGDVELPILYYDFSSVIFIYAVKPKLARPLMKDMGLEPCVFMDGHAYAAIVFFEYRDTSIGVYNEAGLCTFSYSTLLKKPFFYLPSLLKRGEKWKIAACVHNLPVTTKEANAAGREIWGYPKFVTEIPMKLTKKTFEGSVKDPDSKENILSLKGNIKSLLPGVTLPGIDIVTYTVLNGKQIRTNVTTRGKASYRAFPSIKLGVGKGDHIMTQNLRALQLEGRRPNFMVTSYNVQSRLPGGIITGSI